MRHPPRSIFIVSRLSVFVGTRCCCPILALPFPWRDEGRMRRRELSGSALRTARTFTNRNLTAREERTPNVSKRHRKEVSCKPG